MATKLPPDFKEFLKLLADHKVEYILVGGYAVGFYGYVRATADIDIWIRPEKNNAERLVTALREFGFAMESLYPSMFLKEDNIVRLGEPPFRIELMTAVSGVTFDECIERAKIEQLDGVDVKIISLEDLKLNKQAAGRHKDLDDLEHL
jgi:predicted nucleotidyltransferase